MNESMAGKVVLVTGASSGIGAETVRVLLDAGAFVVAVARRLDRLKELPTRSRHPDHCLLLDGDVTQRDAVDGLIEQAYAWKGRLDVLINNAGVSCGTLHEASSPDDFEVMLDTNVMALVNVTRAAIGALKASRGCVVNISSAAAKAALPGGAVYSATKAAVATFSEALRKELAPHHVRVSVIYPGLVSTELFDRMEPAKRDEFKTKMVAMEPLLGRDVADVILFATSRPPHVAINELVVRPTLQLP